MAPNRTSVARNPKSSNASQDGNKETTKDEATRIAEFKEFARLVLADQFKVKERRTDATQDLIDQAKSNLEIRQEISDIISRIAPTVNLEIISDPASNRTGFYYDGIIQVAMNSDAEQTVRHEAIHALRELGLFTPSEWNTLSALARNKWIDEHRIRELYPEMFKADGTPTEAAIEEAIAEDYAKWARTTPTKKMKLFERMRYVFKQIRMAIMRFIDRKQAFRHKMYKDIESGKVGTRAQGKGKDSAKAKKSARQPKEETARQRIDRYIGPKSNRRQEHKFKEPVGVIVYG